MNKAALVILAALTACAKKEEPVEKAVTRQDVPEDTAGWRYTIVDLDPSLVQNCGIQTTETYFKYDSSDLSGNGKQVVDGIADCVTDGPLAGAELVVIGATDPMGTDEYNKNLGMSRAQAVEKELAKNGVPKVHVDTVSLGEAKASASPEQWPKDRQVRVELAPGTIAVQEGAIDPFAPKQIDPNQPPPSTTSEASTQAERDAQEAADKAKEEEKKPE